MKTTKSAPLAPLPRDLAVRALAEELRLRARARQLGLLDIDEPAALVRREAFLMPEMRE